MSYKLRRYYSPDTDGGGAVDTLDSPGAESNAYVNVPDEPVIQTVDTPAVVVEKNPDIPPIVENQQGQEGQEQEEEEEEKSIYALADEALGFGIANEELPEGIDGLAEFGRRSYTKGAEDAVKKEWEELQREAAPAVELAKWLKEGRTETEFYMSKIESPRLEPEALDTAEPNVIEGIIYKNFIKQGFTEATAKEYTQMAIDSNRALATAKEIVSVTNQREDSAKAAKAAQDKIEADAAYETFVKGIEKRIETVKTGKVGNITIPQAQQDAFINANYMNANNPKFPNMSEIDIKMETMEPTTRDMLRYLVHIDFDFNKLVTSRNRTVDVAKAILQTKTGGSTMSGGFNKVGVDDTRTLDSPGT